jgi:TatD DNase family protein
MKSIPYIDLHTHSDRIDKGIVAVKNIFPGEGFGAFTGRNFYSMGLHPWHIQSKEENNEMLRMIEDAMEFDHVCFIGECGLDKIVSTDFEEQKRVFRAQIFMSEEFGKPLVIHCVKAYNEILELRKEIEPVMPWIMHGYNGSLEQTIQMAEKGILFSFGENLYRPDSKAVESFKHLPLEKIFFETDEYDGDVECMYVKGAELKNIPVENLVEAVWNNFSRVENNLLGRF